MRERDLEFNPEYKYAKGGKVLKQISTHKAVRNGDKIDLYLKGTKINGEVYPDEYLRSILYEDREDLDYIFDNYKQENRFNMNELMGFAKGGKTKKFPKGFIDYVEESDNVYEDNGLYYNVETQYAKAFTLQELYDWTQKEGYEFAKGGIAKKSEYISNRDIVSLTHKKGGTKKTLKGSQLVDGAYAKKKIMRKKPTKSDQLSLLNKGGEIVRAYDVNVNSGVGTYARGGITKNNQIIEQFLDEKTNNSLRNISIHYSTLGDVMLLRNYGTLIAKRKGKKVSISNKKYSSTTSTIQNAIERMAKERGMKVERISEDKFARGGKISKDDAIVKALKIGVDFNKDFHAQSFGNELTQLAKETGYRKSKSSSGSTGRAFFEHLEKRYDKNPSSYDDMAKQMARGGKMQGYNAQLDESLGMRRGAKRTKQQSDKDRRDESKAMSKSMGRRAYAGVRGMDKGRRKMAKGGQLSWSYKEFKGDDAQEKANKFISNNKNKYQTQLIFINDGFGVEYRPLRKMAVGGKTTMAGDTDFPSELLNYSKGGKVSSKDVGETIMVIGENNVVGDLIDVDGNTAFVDFSDYENRPRSGKKRDSFNVSEIKVVQYDFDKDGYYAKGGNMPNLKVTDIKYNETRRGISYIAKTNVKGVEIVNDGMGGATFLEGSWKDIKPYNNLDESDLEALINVYEKVYAKGGKFASGGNVSYNGWTNYATWVTNLEVLDGIDWKDYNMGEPISAEMVEDYVDMVMQESPELAVSFANRFLNDVNYREIVEHINDDFDLDDGEKDDYAKGGKMKKPMIRYSGRR